MKIRNGFVSNSSSCSFAIPLDFTLNSKDRDLILDMEFWDIYIERRNGIRFLVGFGADYEKGFDSLPAYIQSQMKYD